MQTSTSEVLKERFFHSFISPKKRKHPGIRWLKTVRQMSQEALMTALLISLTFVALFTWLLAAYQKNLHELSNTRQLAIESSAETENWSQNLLAVRNVLNPTALGWHQIPFYFKLSSQKLNSLLDKKITETARLVCAPAMMRLVCEHLSWSLQESQWETLLETLHIYLMLEGKEPFHSKAVAKWFLDRKERFGPTLSVNERELYAILSSLNAAMFERLSGNQELCSKVTLALQSPELAESVYEFISTKISSAKPVVASSFISKHSVTLFADNLANATFPHLFTKEGYRSFERMQKKLMNSMAAMPYLATVADIQQINSSIEGALGIYKDNYELAWQELLSKLRLKRQAKFEALLANIKRLASELDALFSLVERLEKNLIIEDDLQLLGQSIAKIAPEKLSQQLPQRERMLNHIPLSKETIQEYKQGMKKDLEEIIKQAANLSSSQNLNKACYNLIASLPEEEDLLQKSESFGRSLPAPLDGIYLDFIGHIKSVLQNHSANYINQMWRLEVADYYAKHIAGKYPFNKSNYRRQVTAYHFASFFAQCGRWAKFKQRYLDQLKPGHLILDAGKKAASHFNSIQTGWFTGSAQLKVAFSITNATISGEARAVNLYLLGENVTFSKSYFGPHEFVWQKEAPELARVEFLCKRRSNSSLTYAGTWAWYRLLSLDGLTNLGASAHEKAYRKFSSPTGEMRFLIHFHEDFRPLASEGLVVPRDIVSAISHLEEIYEQ